MASKRDAANTSYWPLWGVAAGALGYVGHLMTMQNITDQQRQTGVNVVSLLHRNNYYVGVVAGFFAVFCLLVFAAGWRRSLARVTESITAEMVPLALTASAGAMILAYGVKGMLAIYLPGGFNSHTYPAEGLYTLVMFDDLAPFMAWFGVTMASAAIIWLALRERQLPIWIGIVSVLFTVVPVGMLMLTGLPGFPGIVAPGWMIIMGVGLVASLRHGTAPARQPEFAAIAD